MIAKKHLPAWMALIATAALLGACRGRSTNDAPKQTTPPPSYKIGGTVSDLAAGQSLVLQNNGGDDLTLSANGAFTFATELASGSAYDVSIKTHPAGQECSVLHGSGTATADVDSVDVSCFTRLALDANPLHSTVILSWLHNGATSFELYASTDANCDISDIDHCADGTQIDAAANSPYTVKDLTNGQHYTFWLKGNHTNGHSTLAKSGARPAALAFNGTVYAIAPTNGGTVYLGGNFTRVGAQAGGGVPLRVDSIGTHPFPVVLGSVYAAVADGVGGWYIGGRFTRVGTHPRNNLAHIQADGSVGAWNPNVNGRVNAMVVSGDTVYVGGDFTAVANQERKFIAALDATTGIATDWDPSADQVVYALASSGTSLYVGGDFRHIGGQDRDYIAALDLATGEATDWDPDADDRVFALAVANGSVYAGGDFQHIGGQDRDYIAALDVATGQATDWDPAADSDVSAVRALVVRGDSVYVGGDFASIGGKNRNHIAALDTATGDATDWNPNADDDVFSFALSDDIIYVGGKFEHIGGRSRSRIAALDLATGDATDWAVQIHGRGATIYALAVGDDAVYAGGQFSIVGGSRRHRLAALDANGMLTAWSPSADGTVNALLADDNLVVAGGSFQHIDEAERLRLAAIDAAGTVLPWDPSANGTVHALAFYSGNAFAVPVIFAGGSFSKIGEEDHPRIAGIFAGGDAAIYGNPINWNQASYPTTGTVYALAVDQRDGDPPVLYAGGTFSQVTVPSEDDPVARNLLAAFDAVTGALEPWDATISGSAVYSLTRSGDRLYAGGAFTESDGVAQGRIAAFDLANDGWLVMPWNPAVSNQSVRTLVVHEDTVYAGGLFTTVGEGDDAITRNRIASFDASDAAVSDFTPNADQIVTALAVGNGTLFVGGGFTRINEQPADCFAVLPIAE